MKYQHIAAYVADQLWAIHPSKLSELLAVLAFRAAGGSFTPEEIQARIGSSSGAGAQTSGGGVAVIPIRGTIAHRMGSMDDTSGGTSCERIGAMLDQVASDPSIGSIVYDVDSPGGTVTGVAELAGKMFALRGQKTQIAVVNGLAASAGYWLASQCDEIVSIPSGEAGSIGVFTVHEDLSKAMAAEGIDITLISAGKYKVEGNPFAPLSDETKAVIQARVDTAYRQFVADVARGRGVSAAAVTAGCGQGRCLSSADALAAGLIDGIGSLEGTIARIGAGRAALPGMRSESDVLPVVADARAARLRLL